MLYEGRAGAEVTDGPEPSLCTCSDRQLRQASSGIGRGLPSPLQPHPAVLFL